MNDNTYIPQVVAWAKARGFDEIRANLPENGDFETPIRYGRKDDEEGFTPDVTGNVFGEKSYFEVVMKTPETHRLVSKLKLLRELAARRGGKLYLMTPKGHYQFARDIANNNQIEADFVRL